jgi:hypothetical protein
MSENEKIAGAEIKVQGRFLKWLDNYWYHYKWVTIVVAFFIIVFSVCTLQMCSKEKNDLIIVYAGEAFVSSEKAESIKSVINAVMPEDFDGDGTKRANLVTYEIHSADQIKEIEAQTDANGGRGYVDRSYNSSNYDNFCNYMQTGDASVCLLEPWLFEELKAANRVMSVSDVLGYIPDGSDGYGVRLGDLEIYESYAVLKTLPEDTVVCLLRPLVVGNSSDEKYYDREREMFSAIIKFAD